MLQQKYVYVYMLVVLGMALLAVSNNFTLLKQQGQSMLVKFEMELESTVPTVLRRANLFSSASSIPSSGVSLPPTTYWHNNQTRVVRDIEYRRIPTWMKEYFDWHRLQTTTMNQTNWYHENRKYLIIRCLRGERCGGLSDRIKPMPAFVALAAHTRRILMIRWTKPAPLEEFLVPNEINWTMPAYFAPVMNDTHRPKKFNEVSEKHEPYPPSEG